MSSTYLSQAFSNACLSDLCLYVFSKMKYNSEWWLSRSLICCALCVQWYLWVVGAFRTIGNSNIQSCKMLSKIEYSPIGVFWSNPRLGIFLVGWPFSFSWMLVLWRCNQKSSSLLSEAIASFRWDEGHCLSSSGVVPSSQLSIRFAGVNSWAVLGVVTRGFWWIGSIVDRCIHIELWWVVPFLVDQFLIGLQRWIWLDVSPI